ncbi:DUF6248 family natural product biosynthesis protein [Streptomyces sp. NPDC000931]|uniref:DUF6248 family natural product biosynthesis protein n=1 Tax=Streptomyces sp. NPDC000931 TaxID=3154372 RepID=UPI00332312D1
MGTRPQRKLTDADWRYVFSFSGLRLHGALIMGVVDPVPHPAGSPMSDEDAAWVREHAWTPALREIDASYPWGLEWSACEQGTCWNCLVSGRCDLCVHRQHGGPETETDLGAVTDRSGCVVARIVHAPDQTPCQWLCRCPCEQAGAHPDRVQEDVLESDRTQLDQLTLF